MNRISSNSLCFNKYFFNYFKNNQDAKNQAIVLLANTIFFGLMCLVTSKMARRIKSHPKEMDSGARKFAPIFLNVIVNGGATFLMNIILFENMKYAVDRTIPATIAMVSITVRLFFEIHSPKSFLRIG